jgi:hypothetical protein
MHLRFDDLELAKLRLKARDLTLVIVKGKKVIFESKSPGVRGLLKAIEKLDKELFESSIADKIVGRAAAMLCAYFKSASVFAVVISKEGVKVLENHNIPYEFEICVPNILNREQTDVCPFEKLTASIKSPKEAYERLRLFARSSRI